MDKLKFVTLENQDGTYSDPIPLNIDSDNVDVNDKTLTEVLGEKVYNFDTIDDVKSNLYLQNGDMISTKGFSNINDGGKANYLIRNKTNEDIEDNDNIIFLDNDNLVAEKIKDNRIEFHAIAKSSATYICKFANGKNMIIDTGISTQWIDIKNAIDSLNITKFDYMIITHPHSDHIGNIQNLINNYDFTNCVCWTGMKPDFINHASQIDEQESTYNNLISLLVNNGLNPIVPLNDSYYEIDNNTKLHFLNTSALIAENYYGNITEYRSEKKLNYNHFSLVTEIIHYENIIMCTGDIERCVEEAISPFVHKCEVITAPHHGVNRDAYKGFYDATMPKYALCMYQTDSDTWVHNYYKSFMYLQENGCRMITAKWTEPVNNLYSFFSIKGKVLTNVLGENYYTNMHEYSKIYSTIHEIIDFTKKLQSEITIEDLFTNMLSGSKLVTTWWETYNGTYSSLYSELRSIFPNFSNGWILELQKGDSTYKQIKIHNSSNNLEFIAESFLSTISWKLKGNGVISNVTGNANLISLIETLPVGNYKMSSYTDDIGDVLVTNGAYTLEINIFNKFTISNVEYTTATIDAILRDTSSSFDNVTRTAICYINTQNTPKYNWIKTNNKNIFILPETTGIDNLISLLKGLNIGQYVVMYKDDIGDVLLTDGFYNLDVTISYRDSNNVTANIFGILRHTGSNSTDKPRVVAGYINTSSTPKYVWHKLNN